MPVEVGKIAHEVAPVFRDDEFAASEVVRADSRFEDCQRPAIDALDVRGSEVLRVVAFRPCDQVGQFVIRCNGQMRLAHQSREGELMRDLNRLAVLLQFKHHQHHARYHGEIGDNGDQSFKFHWCVW